jgi:hypothetical protein
VKTAQMIIFCVQISLHEPGDVGVADYGLAVSPGVLALFELKYSEVI